MITSVSPPPVCSPDTLGSSRWEGVSQLSTRPQPPTLDQPEELQGDTGGSSAQRQLRLSPVQTTRGEDVEETGSAVGE